SKDGKPGLANLSERGEREGTWIRLNDEYGIKYLDDLENKEANEKRDEIHRSNKNIQIFLVIFTFLLVLVGGIQALVLYNQQTLSESTAIPNDAVLEVRLADPCNYINKIQIEFDHTLPYAQLQIINKGRIPSGAVYIYWNDTEKYGTQKNKQSITNIESGGVIYTELPMEYNSSEDYSEPFVIKVQCNFCKERIEIITLNDLRLDVPGTIYNCSW
ncbi:MAG: hypothetical protein V1906_03090, partial [Candidatus Woesearchaeota archaeon]